MSSKVTTKLPVAERPATMTVASEAFAPYCRELGICATCNHEATCLFLKSARHPIVFCEEFDDSGPVAPVKDSKPTAKTHAQYNYGEGQEIGICATCSSKAKCIYRRPGRAIWDCQDYS